MKANPFRVRREQLELTQQQIADAFTPRLSVATVGMWERGINTPRRCLIDQLCAVYRQPREWVEAACSHTRKLRGASLARVARRRLGRTIRRAESELIAAK